MWWFWWGRLVGGVGEWGGQYGCGSGAGGGMVDVVVGVWDRDVVVGDG